MDFIWYYPKSDGTSGCYEGYAWQTSLGPFLQGLNKLTDENLLDFCAQFNLIFLLNFDF